MNTDWIAVRHGGYGWRIRPGLEGWLRGRDWAPPRAGMPGVAVIQRWGSRMSARLAGDAPDGGDLFVKWSGLRHAGEAFRFAVTPSRVAAEWRMNGRLAAAGVAVAECLAVGERRTAGLWRGGVLAMRAVTPPQTLASFMSAASEREARPAIAAAASLTARLHARGFCHRDLHGDNLLLAAGGGEAILVDLHEAVFRRRLPEREWIADLARLNATTPGSRGGRLRFWVRYARARRLARSRHKAWIRAIDRETRRLWDRHYRKRGERLERY